MSGTLYKRETVLLDGTPEKRLFWSIISDYDMRTGLCELVDNAMDMWMSSGRPGPLSIQLSLDPDRQLINVTDDAGGVSKENLRILIAPGSSLNDPNAETIGIFGVGNKRAVVALAENVVIKTHRKGDHSYQIDVTKDWLESPDWEIPAYEIPDIADGMTSIDLSALRKSFTASDVDLLKQHLGETYHWFLRQGNCLISLNGKPVVPRGFAKWAYPRGHEPKRVNFPVKLPDGDEVKVTITAGLIRDRDPVDENYGVYLYCNHRLIVNELKTREVGYFVTSEAGVPHPDASLCRVIVSLNGSAKLMPWNSSKTGINYGHPVFDAIRPTLIQFVSHFSSLSRRLKDDWDKKVFRYSKGQISRIDETPILQGKKVILPALPKVHRAHVETLKARNRNTIHDQPWTLGLVEGIAAVDILYRQKLETKNRIALILLDSNFEIALKEFIVHRGDLFTPKEFSDSRIGSLFQSRPTVIAEVLKKVTIPTTLVDKANHYYAMRNKLIHERATLGVTDSDVDNYNKTIREILQILFGLDL